MLFGGVSLEVSRLTKRIGTQNYRHNGTLNSHMVHNKSTEREK